MRKNLTLKNIAIVVISLIVLILFDQWTKSLAVAKLMNQEPFVIIPKVFQLRYLENRGAAFGMMQGQKTFFVCSALAAILIILYVYFKLPWEKRFHPLRTVGVFIAAGAIGNLIDRVVLGYVVDFFYFELIDFPIFNVADIYVTCATIILALLILFYYTSLSLKNQE